MAHKVMCRACGIKFDTDNLKEGIDWVKPITNYYYHKKCYDDYCSKAKDIEKVLSDDEWQDYIFTYISRELRGKYNFPVCCAQIRKYVKEKGYTPKGIFFALQYFYTVKGNKWDDEKNTLGIVPYIYADSCLYWNERETRCAGIMRSIQEQIAALSSRETVKVKKKKEIKPVLKSFNLDEV